MNIVLMSAILWSSRAALAEMALPQQWQQAESQAPHAAAPLRAVAYRRRPQLASPVLLARLPRHRGAMVEYLGEDEIETLSLSLALNGEVLSRELQQRGSDQEQGDFLARLILRLAGADLALEVMDVETGGDGAQWTLHHASPHGAMRIYAEPGPRVFEEGVFWTFLRRALGYGGVIVAQRGSEVLVRLLPGLRPAARSSAFALNDSRNLLRVAASSKRAGSFLIQREASFGSLAQYSLVAATTQDHLPVGGKLLIE